MCKWKLQDYIGNAGYIETEDSKQVVLTVQNQIRTFQAKINKYMINANYVTTE